MKLTSVVNFPKKKKQKEINNKNGKNVKPETCVINFFFTLRILEFYSDL